MPKGRPGGNPDIQKFQFEAAGDEPNNERLSVWISRSLKEKLAELGPEKNQWIRDVLGEAIDKKLTPPIARE